MLITHDFAYQYGGAERVTQAMAEAFPNAEILLTGGHKQVLERMGIAERVETMLPIGRFESQYRAFAPFLPSMWARRRADVVLSSSYAFAHHVRADVRHVQYCHSPLRPLWVAETAYPGSTSSAVSAGLRGIGEFLRKRDLKAVAMIDSVIASCENVRSRVRRIYRRDALILHPPVDTKRFYPVDVSRDSNLVFIVARLVEPYKAVRSVLKLFGNLPYELVIAGDGRDRPALEAIAPSNVRFLGYLGDDDLREWYSRAGAVLFPSEDDFGIVPLEAMACGAPVVALDAGGARETVVHGTTGARYKPGQLRQAMEWTLAQEWDSSVIRAHAEGFDRVKFIRGIKEIMSNPESGAGVSA